MSNETPVQNSGAGTRPSTSGGVDNLGAADSFSPGQATDAGDGSPAPVEKMADKHTDKAAAEQDDSAPLDLTQSADDAPNSEPVDRHPFPD